MKNKGYYINAYDTDILIKQLFGNCGYAHTKTLIGAMFMAKRFMKMGMPYIKIYPEQGGVRNA